jgi:uncharacterized membrane protein
MALREFSASVTVKCPPEKAFDYFADYKNVPPVLDGVTKWEPLGSKTRGAGALYNVEMNVMGLPLSNVLRLNGFTFKEIDEGVSIELRIAYEPPAAVVGMFLAQSVDGLVRRRLEKALKRVRKTLESNP